MLFVCKCRFENIFLKVGEIIQINITHLDRDEMEMCLVFGLGFFGPCNMAVSWGLTPPGPLAVKA